MPSVVAARPGEGLAYHANISKKTLGFLERPPRLWSRDVLAAVMAEGLDHRPTPPRPAPPQRLV